MSGQLVTTELGSLVEQLRREKSTSHRYTEGSAAATAAEAFDVLKRAYSACDEPYRGRRTAEGAYMPSGLDDVRLVLDRVGLKATHSFLDLGSGDGRVVALAGLIFGAKATGYELDDEAFRVAVELETSLRFPRVSFIKKDFLKANFSEADVIFYFDGGACCTRYTEHYALDGKRHASMPKDFFQKLSQMEQGSRFVLFKPQKLQFHFLNCPCFEVVDEVLKPEGRYSRLAILYERTREKMPNIETIFPEGTQADTSTSAFDRFV